MWLLNDVNKILAEFVTTMYLNLAIFQQHFHILCNQLLQNFVKLDFWSYAEYLHSYMSIRNVIDFINQPCKPCINIVHLLTVLSMSNITLWTLLQPSHFYTSCTCMNFFYVELLTLNYQNLCTKWPVSGLSILFKSMPVSTEVLVHFIDWLVLKLELSTYWYTWLIGVKHQSIKCTSTSVLTGIFISLLFVGWSFNMFKKV